MKGLGRSGDRVTARDPVIEKIEANCFPASSRTRVEAVDCASRLSRSRVSITRSPDHRITRSQYAFGAVRKLESWIGTACAVVVVALREVFDENAYERYLIWARQPRSRESYRAFLQERETQIARKPRCC